MEQPAASDSTPGKSRPSSKKTRSTDPSSAPDSATLQAIQNLQKQIADLEAEAALSKTDRAELAALKAELAELKATKPATAPATSQEPTPSEERSRLAPWCPW